MFARVLYSHIVESSPYMHVYILHLPQRVALAGGSSPSCLVLLEVLRNLGSGANGLDSRRPRAWRCRGLLPSGQGANHGSHPPRARSAVRCPFDVPRVTESVTELGLDSENQMAARVANARCFAQWIRGSRASKGTCRFHGTPLQGDLHVFIPKSLTARSWMRVEQQRLDLQHQMWGYHEIGWKLRSSRPELGPVRTRFPKPGSMGGGPGFLGLYHVVSFSCSDSVHGQRTRIF